MFKRFRRSAAPVEVREAVPARYRLEWKEGPIWWSEQPGHPERADGFQPRALVQGESCRLEFQAPAEELRSFSVQLGTYCRTNQGDLDCTLRGPSGVDLALQRSDLASLEDNGFHPVLDLGGLTFEPGRTYAVDLSLRAEDGNEVALYVAEGQAETLTPFRRPERLDPDQTVGLEAVVRGLLPRYRLDWDDDDASWSTWPSVLDHVAELYTAHKLKPGEAFEFDMLAPAARCRWLSAQFGTFGRRVRGYVLAELRSLSDELLARTELDLSQVSDDSFARVLDLAAVKLEPGLKYRARLQSFCAAGDEVALYAGPVSIGHYELRPRLEGLSSRRTFTARSWKKTRPDVDSAVLIATGAQLDRFGSIAPDLERNFPGVAFQVVAFEEADRQLSVLRRADAVVFLDVFDVSGPSGLDFDGLCFDLHRNRVCTIFWDREGSTQVREHLTFGRSWKSVIGHRRQHARRCHYVLSGGAEAMLRPSRADLRPLQEAWPRTLGAAGLSELVAAIRSGSEPRVAIVSVLHRKADIVETFLEHVRDQTYPGQITTILIDDASPENDAERAIAFGRQLEAAGVDNRRVLVRANPSNLGNCASRLAGLAASDADVLIVMDCDCLINPDFVAAHVFEHWWDDVDVVIGPLNIESKGRDPRALVAALEADPALVLAESELQDPVLPEAFVNCITRNFSVKRRRVVEEPLFDLDFSYSAKPGSGFGWEDVEMGYRLYAKGAVIRFSDRAFAVHCSHASSISDERKVVGSTQNFAKLFRKHPDLHLVARRWATDTYDRIVRWQESLGVASGPARQELDALFSARRDTMRDLLPRLRGERKPLRVLTYRWHVPHQYELYKLPHDFTLVTGLGSPATDHWSFDQRPLRLNARLVPYPEIDERDYDVALLHFDENVLAAHLCNGIIPASWGDAFRHFLGIERLPKVAVCHGTVPFAGQFGLDPARKHAFVPHEEERLALVEALSDAEVKVVCNSHQAQSEWAFADSRVIWHGFDPQEFPAATLERDVLALEADFARPHYRGAWEHEEVLSRLDPRIRVETAGHPGAPIENRMQNPYAVRNFRSYIDRIRSFKFYLNTTLRSPMPRSRGEAMMTGVIPVCLRNHDVDLFIDNGVDGFYADTPAELAGFINDAIRDTDRIRAMSRAARLKALEVFNHDTYLATWNRLLLEVV